MKKNILPNFLVIGAEKAGTTWLHSQLKKHPDIFLPETKEIHFFNMYDSNLKERNFYKLGLKWYKDFFSGYKGEKAVGEVTPMYLCDEAAPERISKILPGVKLIAVLRNPVNRAYSHYNMAFNKKHVKLKFKKIIENKDRRFIVRGLYYKQLKKFYYFFDKKNVLILFYEELFNEPLLWLKVICQFLNVTDNFYDKDKTVYDKVYESASYKSAVILNFQSYIIHIMRKNRIMGKFLNWLKSNGISDNIKILNLESKKYEKIDEVDALTLNNYYKEDSISLSILINRELPY